MMMGLMQNPEVQRQMRDMMARPEFIDQMIAMNPQLQGMAPQMREMMRSEQFREMITNPETMQRMTQMSQLMESAGMGGMGGLGGLGGFGAGAGGNNAGAGSHMPPPGAFGDNNSNNNNATGGAQGQTTGQGNTGSVDRRPQILWRPRRFFSRCSVEAELWIRWSWRPRGLGGFGAGGAAASRDTRAARGALCFAAGADARMGFYDGQANVRALLMAGEA